MMTLWCVMRSPLMIGAEMTKNDEFTLDLLTRREVLEIGKASWSGHPLRTTEEESVWIAPRKDGDGFYAALFNLGGESRRISVSREELEREETLTARELWTGTETADAEGISAELAPHDAAVYRVWPAKRLV